MARKLTRAKLRVPAIRAAYRQVGMRPVRGVNVWRDYGWDYCCPVVVAVILAAFPRRLRAVRQGRDVLANEAFGVAQRLIGRAFVAGFMRGFDSAVGPLYTRAERPAYAAGYAAGVTARKALRPRTRPQIEAAWRRRRPR